MELIGFVGWGAPPSGPAPLGAGATPEHHTSELIGDGNDDHVRRRWFADRNND